MAIRNDLSTIVLLGDASSDNSLNDYPVICTSPRSAKATHLFELGPLVNRYPLQRAPFQ